MKAPRSGYLPSLDGWRAFAVCGVLMAHDLPITIGPFSNAAFKGLGGLGVYLFFAISGILICTRILEEESILGHFHLKSFYIRRVLRIQPAALVYLGTIAVLRLAGVVRESWHYWFGALLFYANFLYRVSDTTGVAAFTGHFWTLSVEEHFYILLSLLLFFFRKNRIAIFAFVIASTWIVQEWAAHHGYYSEETSSRRTQWVILYLLTPSLLALLLRKQAIRSATVRLLKPWVAYLLTFLLMFGDHVRSPNRLRAVIHHLNPAFSWSVINDESHYLLFGFSLWIIASMLHPQSWTTRLLELAPIRYLGRLSYSLYLWHVLFFVPVYTEVGITSPTLLFLSGRPWKYIASFAVAILSYHCIEKPFIRLGHRLAPPATPGHVDLEASASSQPSIA